MRIADFLLQATMVALWGSKADAKSSKFDEIEYPEFAKAMEERGDDLFWRSYKVKTTDGYILSIFNITGKSKTQKVMNGGELGPILLVHGFSTDAITWLNTSDTNELALSAQLVHDGYDVWLGNTRGTRYSQKHEWLHHE